MARRRAARRNVDLDDAALSVLSGWRAPEHRIHDAVGIDNAGEWVFTDTYITSPWATPILGLASLRRFWDAARDGPDEGFRMKSEIAAVDRHTAVVRVHVDYDDGQQWRDLWLLTLNDQGRCEHFEEWTFAPDQDDGHRNDHY